MDGDGPVCALCWASFQPAERFGTPPGLSRFQALSAFASPLRDLIHSFKYRGKGYLGAALAAYMVRASAPWVHESALIVPVPAPPVRRILRGYHPASVLAAGLGQSLGVPVASRALRRRHGYPSQTSLGRRERGENAAASFVAGWGISRTRGRRVLIVDDVCTTGATLSACARILLFAGAASVDALVLAQESLGEGAGKPRPPLLPRILDEAVG